MEWGDLRYVLALSRAGSLVAAARALGVEHTTVGRRIAAIERDLGARLFTRTPDGQQATSAGARAVAAAEAVERAILDLEASISGIDDRAEGSVRVTLSEGFLSVVIPHLPRLYAAHPQIRVELLSGNRVFDLVRGEADVAVRMVPTTQPELIVRKVTTAGWALYASPEYVARRGPLPDPPALHGHHVITYEDPLTRTPGSTWLNQNLDGAEVTSCANSIPAVAAQVAAGLGVSALPCLHADVDPRLVRVSDVVAESPIWVVGHPDRQGSARIRVVWEFLIDLIERERPRISGRPRPG